MLMLRWLIKDYTCYNRGGANKRSDLVLNQGSMGQAQGRELPFDIGDRHSCLTGKTIWSAHDGKRKVNDGSSLFECAVMVQSLFITWC